MDVDAGEESLELSLEVGGKQVKTFTSKERNPSADRTGGERASKTLIIILFRKEVVVRLVGGKENPALEEKKCWGGGGLPSS